MTTKEWLDCWRHRHETGEGDLPTEPLPAPQGVEDVATLMSWRRMLGLPDHEASPDEINQAVADLPDDLRALTAAALGQADDHLARDVAAKTGLVIRYRDSHNGKRWATHPDGRVWPALEHGGLRQSHPLRFRLQETGCYHAGASRRIVLGPPTGSGTSAEPLRWYSAESAEAVTREWREAQLEAVSCN